MSDSTTPLPPRTPSAISDPLAAGISQSLQPDWSNRRKVIFFSLAFCGAMAALIIGTGCTLAVLGVFFHTLSDSGVVLGFLGSALYTLAFVATTIIGSYVFGVNFDWANTRQHIADLVTTTTTNQPPAPRPTRSIL